MKNLKFKLTTVAIVLVGAFAMSFTMMEKKSTEITKVKSETPVVTEAITTIKWFHFTGDASNALDLENPELYEPVLSPTCSSTTAAYRCDIRIQTQDGNDDLPDLNTPVLDERKRVTAN